MPPVSVDPTGVLVAAGSKLFPIGFSDAPPLNSKTPNGVDALHELKAAGGNFVRIGPGDFRSLPAEGRTWSPDAPQSVIDQQLQIIENRLEEARRHGMLCWLYLGQRVPNFSAKDGSPEEALLRQITTRFRGHDALGAYKGFDEPNNPASNPTKAQGLIWAYNKLRDELDPDHPMVIIQAPVGTQAASAKYRPAFDVTGVDVFPISYNAEHSPQVKNGNLKAVGTLTKRMVAAATGGGKPASAWTTLQIAWNGTVMVNADNRRHTIRCFPSLDEERFMAYYAIISGARGLSFFGGHLTQVCSPEDKAHGWNWTFWRRALKPIVNELGSDDVNPALLVPNATDAIIKATVVRPAGAANDVEFVARRAAGAFYLIAARTTGAAGAKAIRFTGLPAETAAGGRALFEWAQEPLPPPIGRGEQIPRPIEVKNGAFQDLFRPYDVHVYRFPAHPPLPPP